MIKWTTPTLKCTIPNDLNFDYIILTLKQSDKKVEKKVIYDDVKDGVFYTTFTQEETSKFDKNVRLLAQLNIMSGDTRLATNIVELSIGDNLHNEML